MTPVLEQTTLEAVFNQARDAWTPDPEDNLDNAWFYSGWAGFTAVCESLGVDPWKYNNLFHDAACWERTADWRRIVQLMRSNVERILAALPKRPERRYVYDSRPEFKPERAREIFVRQFKAKFPGKRVNSKFAGEHWERVKGKAQEIAMEEYRQTLLDWESREQRRDAEYQKLVGGWQARIDGANEMAAFVKTLGD